MPTLARLSKIFRELAQMGVWILVSLGKHLRTYLKDHTRYDRGPEIHGKPWRVLLPVGKAQLAGCLKVWVSGPLERDDYVQGIIEDTVYEASVSTTTPDWYVVLSC